MAYRHLVGAKTFLFPDLKTLMAKATPLRSGDMLAGVAAESAQERVAAQKTLADEGRLSTRIQPNHPTDDPRGVAASMLDGLLLGGGDAVIGIIRRQTM